MRKTNLITGALLVFMGLALLFLVIPAQVGESEDYDLSPSFMPSVATVFGIVMMVLLFLSALFRGKKDDDDPSPMPSKDWTYFGIVLCIMFLSFAAVKYLGFLAGGALMVAAYMLMMGSRKIIHVCAVSILTPVILWVFFWKLLEIPLP